MTILYPVIATEIEFYLHGADGRVAPQQIVEMIGVTCAKAHIPLASVEKERGQNQYEVAFLPDKDERVIIANTEHFKRLMAELFVPYDLEADFSAKPLHDQPGSALHVHVHLEDETGKNMFYREGETFSPHLLYAIGGLLAWMNPCMTIFAPNEASYKRFTAKSNAPTKVSWGTNNRTTAIRLPNKPMDNKHIEHRVSGSDVDVASVIDVILQGIDYGITNKCAPGEPVYGDASLPQYKLPLLARSLEEAKEYAEKFPPLAKHAS